MRAIKYKIIWLENILMPAHLWRGSTQNYICSGLVSEFYGFAKLTFFYVSPTAFFSKVAFIKTERVTIVVFNSSLFFHLALYFSPLLFLR